MRDVIFLLVILAFFALAVLVLMLKELFKGPKLR